MSNETVYEVQVSGTTRVMGLHAPPPVSNSKISLPSDLSESVKVEIIQTNKRLSLFSKKIKDMIGWFIIQPFKISTPLLKNCLDMANVQD